MVIKIQTRLFDKRVIVLIEHERGYSLVEVKNEGEVVAMEGRLINVGKKMLNPDTHKHYDVTRDMAELQFKQSIGNLPVEWVEV